MRVKVKHARAALGVIALALAVVATWVGRRWQHASKIKEFMPIAEVFMARVEARDVATLKRLGLDSAGLASALALPTAQVTAMVRGRLRVVSGDVDNDFARIIFDTDAIFCPNADHPGRIEMQFMQQGGRWIVDRADPAFC